MSFRPIKLKAWGRLIASSLIMGFAGLAAPASSVLAQNAAEIVLPNEESLSIETNRGVLIRLDRAAEDIFIANPLVADVQVKSPRLIYVFGKIPGETTIYALDREENVIYSAGLNVSQNLERVSQSIRQVLPNTNISVRSINGMVIMEGFAPSPDDAETALRMVRQAAGQDAEIINRVSVTMPTQINLQVKIAEVARGVLKDVGFNWDALGRSGDALFGIAGGTNTFAIIDDPILGTPVRQFISRNASTNSIVGSLISGNVDLTAVIDALETEGFLSVLAEPNLTAMSGETANFLAGGEFPIPVPDLGNVSLEFKEFGVGLAFTPRVISENKINLQVAPEVSQLSNAGAVSINGISVPALTTRRASTTVELASGQSFAIAGLLQSSLTQDQEKFPWLGDIPIIGALFRSDRFNRQETELVIIVTPYIVEPIDGRRIALPTDGILAPTDASRIVGDAMPGTQPRAMNNLGLSGGAGFRINDEGGRE